MRAAVIFLRMAYAPHFLVTNDDGIDSPFLRSLADALAKVGRVTVVAPAAEQSWIGRAISRHRPLEVTEAPGFAGLAYAVTGTPTDCVNLALHRLLRDDPPDMVCSGINVGYNCTMPILLSSGTFAGAVEGAAVGLPAAAFSLVVSPETYLSRERGEERVDAGTAAALAHAAEHAARLSLGILERRPSSGALVDNVNFPILTERDTPVEITTPMWAPVPGWFVRQPSGSFRFQYPTSTGSLVASGDLACVMGGAISHSVVNLRAWSDHETVS